MGMYFASFSFFKQALWCKNFRVSELRLGSKPERKKFYRCIYSDIRMSDLFSMPLVSSRLSGGFVDLDIDGGKKANMYSLPNLDLP